MNDFLQNKIKKQYIILFLFLVVFSVKSFAQILNAPIKKFGNICASSGFNSYSVNFDFSGFNPGNTFVLEMSDPSGSFASLTPITILTSQLVTSPGKFTFKVPENINTAGKNYRLRVRSTSPALTSGLSPSFNAYFWVFNNRIRLLDNGSGALSICGTSGTLSIDSAAPSPLQFPGLKYVWLKDGVIIPSETNSTLTVSTAGTYSVQVDYGSCNSTVGFLAYSQDVVVSFTTSTTSYSIISSLGTNICPGSPTTLSTTAGQAYQWYRDNTLIAGATSYSYQTDIEGTYKVVVSPGTACETTSSTMSLTTEDFNLSIDALEIPQTNVIPTGDTITITATTDAANPTFQWLDPNGTSVSNSTTFSTNTPIDGEYKVIVTQTTGCVFPKEIKFKIRNGVPSTKIPNTISQNNDGFNDTWIIPQEYSLSDIEILIVDSYGKEMLKTTNYQNDWPQTAIEFKSVNPVFYYVISKNGSPLKKGSITVIK